MLPSWLPSVEEVKLLYMQILLIPVKNVARLNQTLSARDPPSWVSLGPLTKTVSLTKLESGFSKLPLLFFFPTRPHLESYPQEQESQFSENLPSSVSDQPGLLSARILSSRFVRIFPFLLSFLLVILPQLIHTLFLSSISRFFLVVDPDLSLLQGSIALVSWVESSSPSLNN